MSIDITQGVPGHIWQLSMLRVELINIYGRAAALAKPPETKRVLLNDKICPDCEQDLPHSAFHKRSSSKDGYCYRCKACKMAYDKEKRVRRVRC